MLDDLISLLGVVSALMALLGIGGIALALYERGARRRQYRGLPHWDSPDERVRRALAAYRAGASYRGLR
jgi:hypothetical protein